MDEHLAGAEIHLEILVFIHPALALAPALITLQDRGHAHHQLPAGEGLDHIVVHADLKAMDAVIFLPARRQHDHRRIAEFMDLLGGAESVQIRHHDIHDDAVVAHAFTLLHRIHAIHGLKHLISLKLGEFPDHPADIHFVVHYQNLSHCAITCLIYFLLYRIISFPL